MSENNENLVKILSKRALDFLKNPNHARTNDLKLPSSRGISWDFSLEKSSQSDLRSDKILTLFYFNQSTNEVQALLLETISRLVSGRDLAFFLRLGFREIENFLRDENHLPAFDASSRKHIEESFMELKNSLLVSVIAAELEKNEGATSLLKGWQKFTFVEKNQRAKAFLEQINRLFSGAVPMILALANDTEIAIVMNDFPASVSVIEELVCRSFGVKEEISCVKVVAVQ